MKETCDERLRRIESLLRVKNDDSRPLTLDEAADYLDISPSYLYKLTATHQIPHYKPRGKRIYFLRSELRESLLKNRVDPLDNREEA